MALAAARPFTHEVVHPMSPAQLLKGFRRILYDEVDNLGKRTIIYVLFSQPFHVTRECWTELSFEPAHCFSRCMQHREGLGQLRKNCPYHPLP